MNIVTTAKNVVNDVVTHWKRPAKGNYVSYWEIVSLGIGGMGQQFAGMILGCLALGAGNTLLGSVIGIRPLHLQMLATLQTVLNILFVFLRGKLVDNTRTKWGRFRPYIAFMGFPLVLTASVFTFLPFETMTYNTKLIVVAAFAISISMVSPLFTDTYSEMQTVISPSTDERSKIISINALIYSAAPTITGLFVPMLTNMTGGYTNIATYRYIYVPISVIGVTLNLFTAFNCKERVVSSQTYVQKVGIFRGVLEILRNKPWWIRQIAGLIGFLEGAVGVIFSWLFIYGTQDMVQYGILSTVLGSASGIAMAITPWLLRKLGNRKLLIYHNLFNIVFLIALIFTFEIIPVMFVIFYFNSLVNALANVYNQVQHSEVKDYQQYLSGKRMDFVFGTAGLITLPISMASGYVVPYVYEIMGLTTNYDILFDPNVRNSLFRILCILSVIGGVLNLIPFFFYDMSRERHANIVRCLQYRALFEDYESGDFSPEIIKNGVEGFREALAVEAADEPIINDYKITLRGAKASKDKIAIAEAKKALKDAKQLKLDKAEVYWFIEEIEKYETPEYKQAVERQKKLVAGGLDGVLNVPDSVLADAKAMPKETRVQKSIRTEEIRRAKLWLSTRKLMQKKMPNGGLQKPDESLLEKAYAMPNKTSEEHKARRAEIKKQEALLNEYYTLAAAYIDAQKMIARGENNKVIIEYAESKYDEACQIIEAEEEAQAQKAAKKGGKK